MLKCLFLSPWKLVAAAAVAGFCTGKLPSTNWSVGTGSPLQAPAWNCVQPGEVPSDTTPQCCNCQPWSVCLFKDPSSTWQCTTAHESIFSLTSQMGHSFYTMKQQQLLLLVWVTQEVPNYYQIQISPSSCRLHGTKQKYSTIFSFCTDIKITMICWKT